MEERHATLHVLPTAASEPRCRYDGPGPGPPEAGAPAHLRVMGAAPFARVGVRLLPEGRPGIRVTGESTPDREAVVALRGHRPRVLVVQGSPPAGRTESEARQAGDRVRVLTRDEGIPGPPDAAHGHLPGTATAGRSACVVLAATGRAGSRGPSDGEIAASLSLPGHTVQPTCGTRRTGCACAIGSTRPSTCPGRACTRPADRCRPHHGRAVPAAVMNRRSMPERGEEDNRCRATAPRHRP